MLSVVVVSLSLVAMALGETPEYQKRVIPGVRQFNGPVVETSDGPVLGNTVSASAIAVDVLADEFLGIPFSEPPIGERRWQKPVPLSSGWEGTLNGTVYGLHCTHQLAALYPVIGLGGETSEDCLTLNVHRPNERTGPLPVMVWVFGGGFQLGTGAMYPGGTLATEGQVIVVTFNYRVGPLGFLSTGDDVMPGNYGLWDTQATLRWVQENIAAFGGDPARVTLFGQSAGGAAVSHSVISPQTSGLFQRALAISGTASAIFSYTRENRPAAFALADYFLCGAQTSQEVRDCLLAEDPDDLDYWGAALPEEYGRLPIWLPVIDGDFIPEAPEEIYKQGGGNIPDVDLITGNTEHDAAFGILGNPLGIPLLNDPSLNLANDMESLIGLLRSAFLYAENGEELVQMILEEYPGLQSDDNVTRTLEATKAMTDGVFEAAMHFEAKSHLSASPKNTFAYKFKYRQSFFEGGYPDWVEGSHIDDLYSVFGYSFLEAVRYIFMERDFNEADLKVSSDVIKYISNFAHSGNPNEGLSQPEVVWPQYDGERQHLVLGSDMQAETPSDERLERYQFWNELPDVPRLPENDNADGFERRTPSMEELREIAEIARYNLYEKVGFYEPAMELIDAQADKAISRMEALRR